MLIMMYTVLLNILEEDTLDRSAAELKTEALVVSSVVLQEVRDVSTIAVAPEDEDKDA